MTGYDLLSENNKRDFNRLKALQAKQFELRCEGSKVKVFTKKDQAMIDAYYKMMGYLYSMRKL